MYLPKQFEAQDRAAVEIMRSYPFATLISLDDESTPWLTHLPVHLRATAAEADSAAVASPLVLSGHVAKANPHWRYLQARPQATLSFLGPHAYMSPRVYPERERVPTWNYLAVECRVDIALVEEPEAKQIILRELIQEHDPAYYPQWQSLDPTYIKQMLAGIVAFEMTVTRLQCKLKLNQHRPESHAALRAQLVRGGDNERDLLRWMDRLQM